MIKELLDLLPVKSSDLAFYLESRKVKDYGWFDLMHGYFYGRWTYFYISLGIGEHPLAKYAGRVSRRVTGLLLPDVTRKPRRRNHANMLDDRGRPDLADTYHGKVVPLEAARQLLTVNEDIRLPDLEPVIPYARARDLILKNPDHIVVLDCPCRSARAKPCLPLDVCLVVGEPFASYIIEHQGAHARWITQDEAVAILKAEDERGHVHHAFFKEAMLGRFYAICNCCACCCGAMQMQRSGTPMLAASGYVCEVDETQCIACDTCSDYCQFDALQMGDLWMEVNFERCMGCGVCVSKCDWDALSLTRSPEKGAPLEIMELMAQV